MSKKVFASLLAALAVCLAGCAPESDTNGPTTGAHGGHSHPSVGPHQGHLIELGSDAYHAELLHDAQSVTVYILNGAADQQLAIEASEIAINGTLGGNPQQFMLAASPDDNDPPGKSSRFVSNDQSLADHLGEHGAEPRIVVTIDGKSYRGTLEHSHAH